MANKEKYFYIFHFVDGKHQEFERSENILIEKIRDAEIERIEIDNAIINMENVTKVIIETQTERDEKRRRQDEEIAKQIEAMKNITF